MRKPLIRNAIVGLDGHAMGCAMQDARCEMWGRRGHGTANHMILDRDAMNYFHWIQRPNAICPWSSEHSTFVSEPLAIQRILFKVTTTEGAEPQTAFGISTSNIDSVIERASQKEEKIPSLPRKTPHGSIENQCKPPVLQGQCQAQSKRLS